MDKNSLAGNLNEIRKKSRLDIKEYLTVHPDISPNQKRILKGALNCFEKKKLAEFYPQTQKEIEKEIKPYFIIKRKLIADDYEDAKYFPIYVLRSKYKTKSTREWN